MNENPSPEDNFEQTPSDGLAVIDRQPGTFDVLIGRAIDQNISVEGLERMLAMRDRLKAESAREAFFEALSAFQADCPVIGKDKTAEVKDKATGRVQYTYKYAPLEDIMRLIVPVLRRHGLSVRFDATFEAQPPAQLVACIVNHRDGHSERSEFRAPIDTGARMSVMQQAASSLTYGRRYALLNALGIVVGGEDDDAQGAARSGLSRRGVPGRGEDASVAADTSSRMPDAGPTGPPPRRNVVRIARPSQGSQDSDGSLGREPLHTPVAETPAASENDSAKAELRAGLIRDWMQLLRATGKFNDLNENEMWDKASDVLSAQCQMQYTRPLHEMSLAALQDARAMTDQTLEKKGLSAA